MPSPELLRSNSCSRCGSEMPDNRKLFQCASCSGIPDKKEIMSIEDTPSFLFANNPRAGRETKRQSDGRLKKPLRNRAREINWGDGPSNSL